jgi:hypothetical protein
VNATAPKLRFVMVAMVTMFALTACGVDGNDIRPGVTQRDSAGIAIVSNVAPLLGDADGWTISTEPDQVIGGTSDPDQELFRVRGAILLRDGSIAIANNGTHEARVYGPAGELLRRIGREGEGPGELSSLEGIWTLAQDSIALWDADRKQVIVYDPRGAYARTVQVNITVNRPLAFANGDILVYTSVHDTNPRALHETWWEDFLFVRYNAAGDSLNTIGPLPGMEYMASDWQGQQLRARRGLGYQAATATGPNVFFYGDSREFRILTFEPDGRLARIIDRVAQPKPVTPEIRDTYVRQRLATASSPELKQAYADYFATLPFPEYVPAYSAFAVDPEGNLWVREWGPGGSADTIWSIFSVEGLWLTQLRMPAGDLLEAGTRHVLLLIRDELDVERVALFQLVRTAQRESSRPDR